MKLKADMGSRHGENGAHQDRGPGRPPLTPSLSPRRTRGEGARRAGEGCSGDRFKERRERGSASLVVLAVLALVTLYILSNNLVLHHLKEDLKLVEKHQLKKFAPAKR